jgi:hypothetical protein
MTDNLKPTPPGPTDTTKSISYIINHIWESVESFRFSSFVTDMEAGKESEMAYAQEFIESLLASKPEGPVQLEPPLASSQVDRDELRNKVASLLDSYTLKERQTGEGCGKPLSETADAIMALIPQSVTDSPKTFRSWCRLGRLIGRLFVGCGEPSAHDELRFAPARRRRRSAEPAPTATSR